MSRLIGRVEMWKGLVSHPHVSDKWTPLAHTLDFPKIPQTSSIWPLHPLYLLLIGPRPGTTLASLSSHCGLSWAPPSPGKWQPSAQNSVAHAGWSCTGHKQWLTLHLQGGPEPVHLVDSLRPCWTTNQPLHKQHTQGANSADTKAPLKWVLLRGPTQHLLHCSHNHS